MTMYYKCYFFDKHHCNTIYISISVMYAWDIASCVSVKLQSQQGFIFEGGNEDKQNGHTVAVIPNLYTYL